MHPETLMCSKTLISKLRLAKRLGLSDLQDVESQQLFNSYSGFIDKQKEEFSLIKKTSNNTTLTI
jgi:hypothetical protein